MTMSDTSSYLFVGTEVEALCESIDILKKLISIETGEETLLVRVNSKDNGIPFEVSRHEFVKRSFFDKLVLHGLSIIETDRSYAALRDAVNESERQAPVVYYHESLGFREIQGTQCFLGWKPIGNLPAKYLSSRNLGMQKMLEPRGSFDAWKAFVRKHVVPNTELTLALMLGATGPVSYVLREEGEFDSVPVWALINKSSRGKTTSLFLIAGMFASPQYFIDTFNSTGNALYAMLEQRGGLPFLCDEATHTPNLDWDAMLYTFPTGKERRRCDSKGKLKPMVEFGGAIIMTSEVSILSRSSGYEGQQCRIIEFETNPFDGNPALAEKVREFCFSNYGWVTGPLITMLLDPVCRKKLIRDYNITYETLQKSVKFEVSGVERRLLQRCALILASGNLLRKAVRCKFNLKAVRRYLLNHITKQLQTHDDRSQADIIVDKITNFVCANKDRFPAAASVEKSSKNRHYGPFWGVTGFYGSKSCIWVQEQILKEKILPQEMRTATTTLKTLHEQGYIEKFYDKRYCIKKDFGGMTTTYYCILLSNAPSLLNEIDDNYAPTNTSVATLNARVMGVSDHYNGNLKLLNAERNIPYVAFYRAGNKSFSLFASKAFCEAMAMSSRSTLYATPFPSEKVFILTKERAAQNSYPLTFEKYGEGMVAKGLSVTNLQDKLAFQIPLDHRVVIQEIEFEPYKDKPGAVISYDEPYLSVEPADELPQDYSIKSVKGDGESRKRVRSLLEDDDDED